MEKQEQSGQRKRRKSVKKLRKTISPTVDSSSAMGNRISSMLADSRNDSANSQRLTSKPRLSSYMKRVSTTTSAVWKATSTNLHRSLNTSRSNIRTDQQLSNTTMRATGGTTSSAKIHSAYQHQQQQNQLQFNKKSNSMQRYFDPIRQLRDAIPEINDMFDLHQLIGYGAFSVVILATLKRENKLSYERRTKFAIKHLSPNNSPKRIKREMQFLTKIGGTDNVVKLSCCIRSEDAVAFVMPYLQCEHFKYYYRLMDPAEVQLYMQNLLVALRHVHKYNVIHRDVKPGNFLYNRIKRKFLLVDFGLAEEIPDGNMEQKLLGEMDSNEPKRPSRAGTRGFRPPEVLLRLLNQTTAVDMWAVGVIFLSILCRIYPIFKPPNDQVAIKEIITVFGDKHVCKVAKKLKCSVPVSESVKPLDLRKLCVHLRNLCKNPVLKNTSTGPGSEIDLIRCKNCRQCHTNCLCLNPKNTSNRDDAYFTETTDFYPASAYDLLAKLLQVHPQERITADEALKHEFFRERPAKSGHSNSNFDMPIRGGLLQALNIKQN